METGNIGTDGAGDRRMIELLRVDRPENVSVG